MKIHGTNDQIDIKNDLLSIIQMDSNFHDYFPAASRHRSWGIYATSFGHVRVEPHAPYPPARHPENHSLSWERGRVLKEYQILYISDGSGQFESEGRRCRKVRPGTLLLLFPGVWHRYRPVLSCGWTEHWIELQGDQMKRLTRLGWFKPSKPIYRVGLAPEISAGFAAAEHLARSKPSGFQVRIGLLGLQILTQIIWSGTESASPSRMDRVVQNALGLLGANFDGSVSPETTARQLNVSYSYFRRSFKARTGFSPQQYRLEIRTRHASNLLRNGDLSIKEIAERLGYDSPYHLSGDFKKRLGVSPSSWRRSHQDRGNRRITKSLPKILR